MRPFSQKLPFAKRDLLIQGDSVRQIWGSEDPLPEEERKSLRRDVPLRAVLTIEDTDDRLRLRLSEELEYARRQLDATGDELCADRIVMTRHGMALRSLDKVGQILGHIAAIIRSSDPCSAVDDIHMGDLKARLTRSGAL